MENYLISNYKYTPNNKRNNANKRRGRQTFRRVMDQYHQSLYQYILGILHPERAVNSSNIPKAPNYVSIPTSNITFREAFDILPDKDGSFELFWTPNVLATQEGLNKRIYPAGTDMCYSRNWIGGFDNNLNMYGFEAVPAFTPPASFKKYRLVSAGCRITYKGAIINRAGIISSCLTYRSLPIPIFKDEIDGGKFIPATYLSGNPELWGELEDIDMNSVQNGMWNSVKNVQKDNTTFVVAVPTDPSDFIFEDDAFFYTAANAKDTIGSGDPGYRNLTWEDGNGSAHSTKFYSMLPEDGTPCSYIFKGEGLSTQDKLYVEQFYNFEIIPTEKSATILRPRKGNMNQGDFDKSIKLIDDVLTKSSGQISNNIDNVVKDLIESYDSISTSNIPVKIVPVPNTKSSKKKENALMKLADKAVNYYNKAAKIYKTVANNKYVKGAVKAGKVGMEVANILKNVV